jgi:antitoxin component of MazEF toxin-antitoxin module
MTARREWIGRFRRNGNTYSLFIPLEMRKVLAWPPGSYVVMTIHDGLVLMRRVDASMITGKEHGPSGGDRA